MININTNEMEKNVLYFFYNIAQRIKYNIQITLADEQREISCVDIKLYQHGS